MTNYRVIFDDPDSPDEITKVLIPSDDWMKEAMEGKLPPISVHWVLQDAEAKAHQDGTHEGFSHDWDQWIRQFTAPRVGPLTEEEAIQYLCMKELPRKCWSEQHNRPMFKIVTVDQIPSDRTFRDAWEMKVV